jgi:hypothetical protein
LSGTPPRALILKWSLWIASLLVCSIGASGEVGKFSGKIVVEWLDDDRFVFKMKLVEDFAFQDADGRSWIAPKGAVLDGSSIPLVFRDRIGLPFDGSYRRAVVIYDHYCRAMSEPWRDVHRMFYRASIADGVSELDAKLMYMLLYAGGPRWERRGSSCFRSCHAAAPSLAWEPALEGTDLQPVSVWVRQTNPPLDEIDARVDAVLKRPGPHIFAQVQQ